VLALGGLYVIGTNRHESRRIDLQLRGRCGRQGDPGETRFFVSLEDDLLVRYGIRSLIPEALLPPPRPQPVEELVVRREVARAQRIVEGQDLEIRRTLRRYAAPVEEQRRAFHARRLEVLLDKEADPRTRGLLLALMDEAWRDHLAQLADLRDGIHLVRLGGDDPLARFHVRAGEAYRQMTDDLDARIEAAEAPGAAFEEPHVPSSTWTYLVNDDPFRDQLGSQLTGPGRATLAVGGAVFAMPLLILLGLADRFLKKRPRRR
jgi:preprotein translocase subunit SecA